MSIDLDEIRRLADAAARDLMENRWDAYLAMVERVEARPENQSGAEKSWVERVDQARRMQIRAARRIR